MPDLPDWLTLAAIALAILFFALWIGSLRGGAGARSALSEAQRNWRDAQERAADAAGRAGVAEERAANREATVAELREELSQARQEARLERDRIERRAEEERDALAGTLEETRRELADLRAEHTRFRTAAEARDAAHDKQLQDLREIRADMVDRFKAITTDSLKLHGDNFQKANDEKIRALLDPMAKHIGHFQTELRQAHEGAIQDRQRLKTEIEQLTRRSEQVSQEAVALTNALKGDKQRQGAWGEMVLETLLESSGLQKGREYVTQFAVTSEDGARRRPDVVVNLPGGRAVVIDSKVSLVAYEAAVNAVDDEERARQMRVHAAAVKTHIDELSGRDYAGLVDGAVDYVLMFMPVEGALAMALEERGDLTSYAIQKRVGIATPTTLMVALRTVEHVWTVERRESNAEEIAKRAGLIYDKMESIVSDVMNIGGALDRARQMQSDVMDRLSRGNGNIVGQFEKMKRLGARTQKSFGVPHDGSEDDEDDAAAAAPLPEPGRREARE